MGWGRRPLSAAGRREESVVVIILKYITVLLPVTQVILPVPRYYTVQVHNTVQQVYKNKKYSSILLVVVIQLLDKKKEIIIYPLRSGPGTKQIVLQISSTHRENDEKDSNYQVGINGGPQEPKRNPFRVMKVSGKT